MSCSQRADRMPSGAPFATLTWITRSKSTRVLHTERRQAVIPVWSLFVAGEVNIEDAEYSHLVAFERLAQLWHNVSTSSSAMHFAQDARTALGAASPTRSRCGVPETRPS